VVERDDRHRGVERGVRLGDVEERDGEHVALAAGVDRDDLVAEAGEQAGEVAASGAHLEQPRGRGRKARPNELLDSCVDHRSRSIGAGTLARMDDIIITTTNDLPGFEVTQVHGEIFGLIVRARNVFSNIGAGFRTVFGGEAKGYTSLLTDSRNEAVERLKEAAREKGANAVLAMRFDCNEIADIMSEVAAYGTAVTVRRV